MTSQVIGRTFAAFALDDKTQKSLVHIELKSEFFQALFVAVKRFFSLKQFTNVPYKCVFVHSI